MSKRRKKTRKGKEKVKSTKIKDIAWGYARSVKNLPAREHVNETFINEEGKKGCIPSRLQYGYQYCHNCHYNPCMKTEIQWRLVNDRLIKNAVPSMR